MTKYADNAHPPNAHFPGEHPQTVVDIGPANIKVTLDTWGPKEMILTTLYDTMTATWGHAPTRSATQPCMCADDRHYDDWPHVTGWCRLTAAQKEFVAGGFAGRTLQQDLEGLSLYFTISGVSRAFTHEFVRTRIGAAFKQHGGRDNDWRHQHWTMTEAMERMCVAHENRLASKDDGPTHEDNGKRHAILDWSPIEQFSQDCGGLSDEERPTMRMIINDYLEYGKRLYASMVDAGIAWQDARRVLPIGTQTYVHGIYNFVGFRGAAANRLEFIMDWEINCVFQLMLREIRMQLPPFISQYLGSHSDIAGKAMFDQLQLCPPDGKYPSTTIRCRTCGHHEANHHRIAAAVKDQLLPDEMQCEVCARDGHGKSFCSPLHRFIPEDTLPRIFRREQQPFFVLHPDSMNGGPIQWLWTNGHYQDIKEQL